MLARAARHSPTTLPTLRMRTGHLATDQARSNPQPCSPIVPASRLLPDGCRALPTHGKQAPRADLRLRPQWIPAPGEVPRVRSPRTTRPCADCHAMPCPRLAARPGQPRRPDAVQGLRASRRGVWARIGPSEFQGTPALSCEVRMLSQRWAEGMPP